MLQTGAGSYSTMRGRKGSLPLALSTLKNDEPLSLGLNTDLGFPDIHKATNLTADLSADLKAEVFSQNLLNHLT